MPYPISDDYSGESYDYRSLKNFKGNNLILVALYHLADNGRMSKKNIRNKINNEICYAEATGSALFHELLFEEWDAHDVHPIKYCNYLHSTTVIVSFTRKEHLEECNQMPIKGVKQKVINVKNVDIQKETDFLKEKNSLHLKKIMGKN